MESTVGIRHRNREFAARFLRTAVVVDDEAFMADKKSDGPEVKVETPGRGQRTSGHEDRRLVDSAMEHGLNARAIMDSFSKLGVICGVIGPSQLNIEAIRRTDIVVLDWLLQNGGFECTLKFLKNLLIKGGNRNSLRLVAIYTGEARFEKIHKEVFQVLKKQ